MIPALFIAITVLTLFLFRKAGSPAPKKTLTAITVFLLFWLLLQAVLSLKQVYSTNLSRVPPSILLFGILPMLLVIAIAFLSKGGRRFIDRMSIERLVLISVIRIPVELGLSWLYHEGKVPKIMTFEGANFDIISGITAPVILLLLSRIPDKTIRRNILLSWNCVCLGLLLVIVALALLSAPTPLQKLGFEQPNTAIFYFPVSWLPTFIVPIVLFSHLALFRKISCFSK